ncbi:MULTISPECIES: hypothetical protein [Marinobacter]|uniref:Uncharacterized protein n=1 Tax=Marinobacter segnicrescens TaxID=430453 RepID=A0A1I0CAD5_9GAMM|nr:MULTISPECIES: hypothetical protein [Marinobacter]UZD64862.1 hypothetical protein LJ360_14840 [Marinobacter sp. AN1]SET15842.1 hypothetical protein SAMN04487962_10528 [Marinobacter segnicrescens]|tara:strand:- start:259 stop:429 length:171 start_codon:yes stop_codon:yes gene_type:complete
MNQGLARQQADLLQRLHENKQRQLTVARRQGNALLSSVLEAEARAIGDAIELMNRR